jgi:PAS domain-containing protein
LLDHRGAGLGLHNQADGQEGLRRRLGHGVASRSWESASCHYKGHPMKDRSRTNEELKEEISILKQKIQALELSEAQLKLTDEALKKSEEKYKKAFHPHQDSININRLADGMYVSINEGFAKMSGYAEAEIIGRTSVEFITAATKYSNA